MTKHLKDNIIYISIKAVIFYLSASDKRKALLVFVLLILSSVVEIMGMAALVPVIMILSSQNNISKNKFFSFLFSALEFESYINFVIFVSVLLIIGFMVKNMFVLIVNFIQVKFTEKIAVSIVDSQYDKYQYLKYSEFSTLETSSLVNGILAAPFAFVNGVIRQLFLFFSEVTIMLIVVVGLIAYKPVLFLVVLLILLPAIAASYLPIRKAAQKIGSKIEILRPLSYTSLANLFSGMIEIKIANKQEAFKSRLIAGEKEIQSLEAKSYLFSLVPSRIIEVIAVAAIIIIFIYSIVFDKGEGLAVSMGVFAAVAYRIMPSINRLITSTVTMKQHMSVIETLKKYRFGDYVLRQNKLQGKMHFESCIKFVDIKFAFNNLSEPVLKGINFNIDKGDKVGIIGASGSGKTTLMNILLRIYNEQNGGVYVDDARLTMDNIAEWYNAIGYVKQNTFLMADTIVNNITLRDEFVDTERLNMALELSSLTDFVSLLPQGIHTNIGEAGSFLSGGQRQRIGIARALYKQADVLIMDEATSALDSKTEMEINDSIKKISGTDITMFIVAHRYSALQNCNKIIELQDGKISRILTYDELLNIKEE